MIVGTTKIASNLSIWLEIESQDETNGPTAVLNQFAKIIGAQSRIILNKNLFNVTAYFVSRFFIQVCIASQILTNLFGISLLFSAAQVPNCAKVVNTLPNLTFTINAAGNQLTFTPQQYLGVCFHQL